MFEETHVTSEELLLAEDLVVDLEALGEGLGELGDARLIGLSTAHGNEDLLGGDAVGIGLEVGNFNRSRLLEETVSLDVGGVGEEVGLVLGGEVTGDSTALVNEEAIILLGKCGELGLVKNDWLVHTSRTGTWPKG